jgi:hypothetical protein
MAAMVSRHRLFTYATSTPSRTSNATTAPYTTVHVY